jgi:hypothetical protein
MFDSYGEAACNNGKMKTGQSCEWIHPKDMYGNPIQNSAHGSCTVAESNFK